MGRQNSTRVLLAIGLFKLLKAALLIGVAVAASALRHDGDVPNTLWHVASELRLDPHNHLINRGIGAISGLDAHRLQQLRVGTFVYAIVFLIEGTGLLLRKRWAEYLTIGVTASFIPLEIYEMVHKPSVLKALGIVLNAAIVLYLVARRWRERAPARQPWTA